MSRTAGIDPQFVDWLLHGWRPRGVIFTPDPAIGWMAGGAGPFFALPDGKGQVRLFLAGRDRTIRSRIGVVTLQWTDRPQVLHVSPEPVFDVGELGTFDMDGAGYPWIVENGGALWMYYLGWNRLGGEIPFRVQVGLAVSTDGGRSFERVSRAPILPLIDAEPIGTGSICVERAGGGDWRMYYTRFIRWERRPDGPRHYYHVCEAHSSDGIKWERTGKVVIDLIAPDEYALGAPDLAVRDGRRLLYFTARGHRYRLFVSVESESGEWTRLPAPIEIPRSEFDSDMQCYPRNLALSGRDYLLYSGNGYGRAGIGYAELVKT